MYTAQDIFTKTIAYMNEQQSNASSYSEYYIPILNLVMSETFNIENALRVRDGMPTLDEFPEIDEMSDTVPYHRELVMNVLPYGIGMHLFLGDDENVKASFFNSKYEAGMKMYQAALYVETEAVF